tara:strand:+ start:115 stop:1083 length:969 start_codon:yes stop_codon:yes gene_type:complete
MKSFKQFLLEIRDKTDPHEKIIRGLASLGRMDYMRKAKNYYERSDDHVDNPKQRSHFGDCDYIAHHVANRLRHTYPSVKVAYSHKFGHSYPDDPDGSNGLTGHAWVEIPETGHFVDPSHDMFRIKGNREHIPTKGMSFPQSAVKIGKMESTEYKTRYDSARQKKKYAQWVPGKVMSESKDMRTIGQFADDLEKKHGAKVHLDLHNNNEVHLYHIEVPKGNRRKGVGSAIMQEINAYADQNKRRVTLNPASKDDRLGTTSRNRLIKFYKRHGYVHNKGRNKDFRTSAAMYRDPKKIMTESLHDYISDDYGYIESFTSGPAVFV